MSLECNDFHNHIKDIEEELEQFFIRKTLKSGSNADTCTNVDQRVWDQGICHKTLPLLICDLVKRNHNIFVKKNMSNVFSLPFKYCLLLGRIVGRTYDNKFYKYIIDDSTGIIEIRIYKRQSELERVHPLEIEVESLKLTSAAQNKFEIAACLQRLLRKVKIQMDFSNIPVGSKVLVYGRPSVFRDKISIDVISLYKNYQQEDMEIEYKDMLIKWYCEK